MTCERFIPSSRIFEIASAEGAGTVAGMSRLTVGDASDAAVDADCGARSTDDASAVAAGAGVVRFVHEVSVDRSMAAAAAAVATRDLPSRVIRMLPRGLSRITGILPVRPLNPHGQDARDTKRRRADA